MTKPAKVLIVDDEPHVLSYVSMLLRASLGELDISQCGTADEAVALFKSEKPDLVLLDINLVGTNGLEVLRTIMEIDPEAVVVMLSTVNTRSSVEQAVQYGASGYLLKNLHHEELAKAFKDLVDQLFGEDETLDTPGMP